MKTIKTLFLLTLLMPFFGLGQTGNEFVLNIGQSVYYDSVYKTVSIVIQNNINTTIGGEFESAQSVVVKPKTGTSIQIVDILAPSSPSAAAPPGGGNGYNGGGGGTTIRSRPPDSGPRLVAPSESVSDLTVFPNPVDQELHFQLKEDRVVGFSIFDLFGKKIVSEYIEPINNHILSVSMLDKGCYILQLSTEKNQNISIQFIKK